MGPVVVQKYGGSSVRDLDALRAVADRIRATREAGRAVVVVVSAMGNTTNALLDLARQVAPRPPRRELDMLVSVGERVAMALLAMALEARGVPAISLTGSQSGIITDEVHTDARVLAVRPDRVRAALASGRVAIVAGFQGVSRTREVTTLGRGGSDTTAVALAAALGAEYCEICSDVRGLFTADPRAVPGARLLPEVPLDQALAMAREGARILHDEAVALARRAGVEIRIAESSRAEPGTRLVPAPDRPWTPAVAARPAVILLRGPGAARAARASGAPLLRAGPDHALVDPRRRAGGAPLTVPPGVEVDERHGTVALVGGPPSAEEVLAQAGDEPANWWWTPDRAVLLVRRGQVQRVAARLHAAWCT